MRSRNDQLEALATEQKSKTETIDELNKEISEKNKVTEKASLSTNLIIVSINDLYQFQSIKLLKQRLADFKKTLQNEFKGSMNHANSCLVDEHPNEANDLDGKISSMPVAAINPLPNHCTDSLDHQNRSVVMDDVNFKYLKHVVLKFLTSREVGQFD